ncbi:hypothetical protein Ct61P_01067 [Colletotrichum tofieldiae]|nr:hypothetical protein Ct61P_01067 [Colletotrichum tofieldiae]
MASAKYGDRGGLRLGAPKFVLQQLIEHPERRRRELALSRTTPESLHIPDKIGNAPALAPEDIVKSSSTHIPLENGCRRTIHPAGQGPAPAAPALFRPLATRLDPARRRDAPKTGFQEITSNPFSPQKHAVTGKWHDPVYSLRRQAEIVKLARQHGVEELLPPTVKGTEYRIAHRVEHGLRVKGTGVGQKVKGKIHERMVQPRMEKRREAMLAMPKLIKEWKKVGKRNWTRFPK